MTEHITNGDQLQRLTAAIAQLRDTLAHTEQRRDARMIELAEFQVGDLVVERGTSYEIVGHDPHSGWMWYWGSKRNKNGELSQSKKRLYDAKRAE